MDTSMRSGRSRRGSSLAEPIPETISNRPSILQNFTSAPRPSSPSSILLSPGTPVTATFKMPAFHTKTIQSILEPVAVQVSTMIILDEEASKGSLMPDLSEPVTAVSAAVSNLVKIGQQTAETSDDEKLQEDMPSALAATETASSQLAEAANSLKANPSSVPARKMLVTGARGILEGVSDLLLTFDESEVRRIVAVCNSVLEYLGVSDVIEQMEDLATFIKNLTPGLTGMSKLVDQRQKELTNPVHAAKLLEHSTYVKKSAPMLISAIKVFCSLKAVGQPTEDAVSSRKWVVTQMSDSLKELIRILQLTSSRDDVAQGDFQEMLARMTGKEGHEAVEKYISTNFQKAQAFLGRMDPAEAEAGMTAIRRTMADARALANEVDQADREEILKHVSELDKMMAELERLKAQGKLDTPEGRALAKKIAAELEQMEQAMKRAIVKRVARDFVDPTGPAKQMAAAAMADKSVANREEMFRAKADQFRDHADNATRTALQVAQSGGVADEQTKMAIMDTAKKVQNLVPQLEGASRMVLQNPTNEAAVEHMEMIKTEYMDQMGQLKDLVDQSTDSVEFLKVSEASIAEEIEAAKAAARNGDGKKAMALTAMVVKRSKRVLDVARAEAENSEDPQFVERVTAASAQLAQAVGPMAASCKQFAANPTDAALRQKFEGNADKVSAAVTNVRSVVEEHHAPPRPPTPPPVEEVVAPPEMIEEEEVMCEVIALPDETSGPALPIVEAARDLHEEATKWSIKDNSLIAVARKMAQQMAEMGRLFTSAGDTQSRKELINLAKAIAASTSDIIRLAKTTAEACTDRRLKQTLLQLVDRLPTISTQLRIISTVKATHSGRSDARADREASETLVLNAQNLMKSTKEVVQAAQAATLKLRPGSAAELMWRRRD